MSKVVLDNGLGRVFERLPLAMSIIGKRRSGKSFLLVKMLNSKYFKKKFESVYIFSPTCMLDKTWNDITNKNVIFYDEYDEEIIQNLLKLQEYKGNEAGQILIVLDDFAEKLKSYRGNVLEQLALRGRHYSASFIFTSQKYNLIPTVIRNNTDEFIFFKVSNNQELKTIIEEQDNKDLQKIGGFEKLLFDNTKGYDYLVCIKGKEDVYYRGNELVFKKINM